MCPESRTALFSPELFKKLAQGGALERPNSCVANFYSDGMQSVDWHADNEPLFEGLLDDCAQTSSLFQNSCLRPHRQLVPGRGADCKASPREVVSCIVVVDVTIIYHILPCFAMCLTVSWVSETLGLLARRGASTSGGGKGGVGRTVRPKEVREDASKRHHTGFKSRHLCYTVIQLYRLYSHRI